MTRRREEYFWRIRLSKKIGVSIVRVPIPEDISAEVLFQHDHTCCVCNQPGKAVQIHHVDDDHTNNDPKNLAVLWLADHDLTQIKGGFGRKLSAAEVTKNRDGWVSRVQQRRVDADKLAVGKMIGVEFRESAAVEAGWKQPSSKLLATYVERHSVKIQELTS
jgi:hypothetical protein